MKSTGTVFLTLALLLASACASEAEALLKATGQRGGICLITGAKDLNVAKSLAGASSFYVQVLQSDAKKATEWGALVARDALREKLGVRDAKLDPEHYGSKLLNLVVVEDGKTRGGALDVEGLARILTPEGILAVRDAPASFAARAKAAGLLAAKRAGPYALFRKPLMPVKWQPCDSLKWRAGMRAHMAKGICGPTHGSGKFFYREWFEADGGWPNGTTQLFARDAHNGRIIWTHKENVPWKHWRTSAWTGGNWTLGADDGNRLFAVTHDGKLVCLDANTGKQRFVLMASGARPGYVRTYQSKYVLYGNTVFSAENGKQLWRWKGKYTMLYKDSMIESDGNVLRVRKLADGGEVFKAGLEWRADRARQGMRLLHTGNRIIVIEGDRYKRPHRVTALDPKTGKKLWSQELGGMFAWPWRGAKGKTFAAHVSYTPLGGKLLAYANTRYFYDRNENQKEIRFTRIDLASGKVEKEDYGPKGKLFGSACATEVPRRLGDYLHYHHNVWLKLETFERYFPNLVHPSCSLLPPATYGMIYNSPGRKGGSIQGITAIGPADIKFDQQPGGKVLRKYSSRPGFNTPTVPTDWPTFRANNARGNSAKADLGAKLTKVWEKKIGLGGRSYGQMSAERFGLTQPTIAYGTAYVADIPAQRIVALDVKDGKEKWVYHVGSRVDFPPTLYKGLCLFAAKNGFVYCLDAKSGKPVYKLLVAPRERLIGGQEKLESLWPAAADVMVDAKGIGHASAGFASTIHGGNRVVRFNAETGQVVESKVNFQEFAPAGYPGSKNGSNIFTEPLKSGFRLSSRAIDDMLGYGNSISRTNEDRVHELFGDQPGRGRGRTRGRVIAFDEKSCVSWSFPYGAASWAMGKPMTLMASNKSAKSPLWKSKPIELIADDIVLTPKYVYCVGHYRRVKGEPEVWVLSRADGKVLSKTPVGGLPSFLGTSASGKRLFVSTRDGKLVCLEGK